jgi:hypothetical protein
MKKAVVLVFISLIINSFAQEGSTTAWLINGKKLTIGNYKFVENGNILAYENKKGRIKELDRMELFSIINSAGTEKVFFNPDTLDDKYYTVENMRSFVNGGFDGTNETNSWLAFAAGFAGGFAGGSGYVIPNAFYGLIIPAACITIVGLTRPNTYKIRGKKPEWVDDEFYFLGYEESAHQIRIKQAIKGSLAGLVVGLAVGMITGEIN